MKNICRGVSRREFLTTSGGAMLLGPGWLNAAGDGFDKRVAQVMSGIVGIDMHNHVYPGGRNRIRMVSRHVGEMLRQGFTADEIGKVGGGNFCRVFDKVTVGHS